MLSFYGPWLSWGFRILRTNDARLTCICELVAKENMYYVQFLASLIRDFTSLHHSKPSADVAEFLAFVSARQHAECPMWFHKCKDRSSEVPRSEWLHERFLPPDFRAEELGRVLKCTHILERHAPSVDCVCTHRAFEMYHEQGYTLDAYRRRPDLFDAFWISSVACVALAELIEYEGAPLTVTLSKKLALQKGLEAGPVRVLKPSGRQTERVEADKSLVSSPPIENKVADVRILDCRWDLSEDRPMESYLFVQNTIETLAIPFKLERDPSTGRFWVRVFMLEITVVLDDAGEFTDKLVVNPWYRLLKTSMLSWRTLLDDCVTIVQSMGYVDSSEAQTVVTHPIEMNIRDAWGVSEFRHYVERPKNTVLSTDFSNGVVWCTDFPDYPEDITHKSQLQLRAPETPFFTRETLCSLVQATRDRHVAHMLVRSDAHTVSAGTTFGHVTVTYGPATDICMVYVTTCYKVGVHHRIGHVAMVSRDVARVRAFFMRNMQEGRAWVMEDVFLAIATRVCRLCSSASLLMPPIPVGRVLFRDEYVPVAIQKGTWRLSGCNCLHCGRTRSEPFR